MRRIALDVSASLARGAEAEQLRVAADGGQRRAQLVRRVGQEPPQAVLAGLALREGALEAVEHGVEGEAEAPDLRARLGGRHAAPEVAAGDRARGRADPVERAQAEADDERPQAGEDQQHARDDGALDAEQPPQLLVDLAQRNRDDRAAGAAGRRRDEHAVARAVGGLGREGVAGRGPAAERQRRHGLPGHERHGGADRPPRGVTALTVRAGGEIGLARPAARPAARSRPVVAAREPGHAGVALLQAVGDEPERVLHLRVDAVVEELALQDVRRPAQDEQAERRATSSPATSRDRSERISRAGRAARSPRRGPCG